MNEHVLKGLLRLVACVICACTPVSKRAVVEVQPKPGDAFDISVRGKLASECGLAHARYHHAEADPLARLADCLTRGSLRGEQVRITGSEDTRARRVAAYLAKRGVAKDRIKVVERGTLSTGMSETNLDKENERRVQIELVR
jgi:hypothetical protein